MAVKVTLQKVVFPEGSIRTVLWGPCRGLRYKIFPGYGWAYLYGNWERKVTRIFEQRIRPGSTIYDLGANYGMHTLLFSKLVGPSGRVYAFEPNPEIFAALKEQLRLNGMTTVIPVCKAVSSDRGEAWFDAAHHGGAGHLSIGSGTFKVETTSLDDFVFRDRERPPDFLKIDIEGAESSALRGAANVIKRYRPDMVIELHNPTEDRSVGAILKEHRYSAYRVQDGSKVQDLDSGWPNPNGISGIVYCSPE